jgi:hypothetical protein
MIRTFLIVITLVVLSANAWAYPNYVRLGYVSCAVCHVSSQGQGLLTEYGKSIAAGSAFFSRESREETQASFVRWGLQARAIAIVQKSRSEFFPMQLDGMTSIGSANLRSDAVIGVTPLRQKNAARAGRGALGEDFVLRKALIAGKPTENMEWILGRDFASAGIATDDHTAFIRALTRRGVTDYPTQARLDLSTERWLHSYAFLAPSFEESFSAREYGVSARLERILNESATVGGLVVFAKSNSIERLAISGFTRWGFTSSLALVSEIQLTTRELRSGQRFEQWIAHARPSLAALEWVELALPVEVLSISPPFQDLALQSGPSANLRLIREASLLLDGRWTLRGGQAQRVFLAQVFVHL